MAAKTPSTKLRTGFTVTHGSIRIKVKLLPTVADVHRSHQTGCKRAIGETVYAYFVPSAQAARHVGTIVLPMQGNLNEWIPHEVTHAVIHALNGVLRHDDEDCATAIGCISARIFKRVNQTRAEAV